MASMSKVILGVIFMVATMTGFYLIYGNYYANMGSTAVLPSSGVNQSGVSQYIENWGNQTQKSLANAQAIPFFGGSFMLLTGGFQSITLLVGFPGAVVYPLLQSTATALAIPFWLVAFISAAIILMTFVYLLHALGIGGV